MDKASALVDALGQDIEESPDSELDQLGINLAKAFKERESAYAESEQLESEGQEQEARDALARYEQLDGQISSMIEQIINTHIQRWQFKYEAKNSYGDVSSGVVDAKNSEEATKILSDQGLEPLSLEAVMEDKSLGELVSSRVDRYKKKASEMGIQAEEIGEAHDTLYALISNFAAKYDPSMRNSLTSYVLANLKWAIMPANPYYQFMKYIKHPEDNFSKEINDKAAEEGWPLAKKIFEQYKLHSWGDNKRVKDSVDWWNKTYKSLFPNAPLSQIPGGPLFDPSDPNTNESANLNAFNHMVKMFDSVAKNPKAQEIAKQVGLVEPLSFIKKQYQKKGKFWLEGHMFDPEKLTPSQMEEFNSPDTSEGGGYKKHEIRKWNEMYDRIANEAPELVAAHPDAKPLTLDGRPKPEEVEAMSRLFDDFVETNKDKAIEIGLADREIKNIKPYIKDGKYFLSQQMVKPSKRGIHLKQIEEAINSLEGGGSRTVSLSAGDEEGRKQEIGKGKGGGGVIDAPSRIDETGPASAPKQEVNPMTAWRRQGIPKGVEGDVLSSVWGKSAANNYASIKAIEDEIKGELAEPVDDEQMKEIMLGIRPLNGRTYEKAKHLSDLIGMYFDPNSQHNKYNAEKVLSEVSRKWEGTRPSITGKLPKEAIDADAPRRYSILKLLAEKATSEGTLERKIADVVSKLPFEASSIKAGDINYEMHNKHSVENRRTMKSLFESSKPSIEKLIREEDAKNGISRLQSEVDSMSLAMFNRLVRSVMGKMMGALAKPETEKELAAKGLELKGSWKMAFVSDLRIMRLALSSTISEKTS